MNELNNEPNEEQTPQQAKIESIKNMTFKQWLPVILTVVIIALAGLGIWLYSKNNNPAVVPTNTDYSENNEPPAQEVMLPEGSFFVPPVLENTDPSQAPQPNAVVQWKLVAINEDLKLVKSVTVDPVKIAYYEMGTRNGNKIILALAPAVDPSGPATYFFEKTPKGYVFMSLVSNRDIYRSVELPGNYALSPSIISADTKTYYIGIVGPSKFVWSGVILQQQYLSPTTFFDNDLKERTTIDSFSAKKVATVKDGELYLFQNESNTEGENIDPEKFYIRRYVLKLPSGFFTTYNVTYDFIADDRLPKVTWSDGSVNKDTYRTDASLGGCGNPGAYIVAAKDVSLALKVTGTASNGMSIYEFKDINDKTLQYFYHLQGGKVFNQETSQMEPITIENWYAHHPVIAVKNSLGDYALMTSESYGIAAECGKPVVYLYPTKPTNITVKVGANITKSEPSYGEGWKVLAQPSGQLRNANGQVYDSLFWEGLGHGDYPQINEGTVVARSEVEKTITAQLKQLGLNDKESADFKEFWMDKMPNTPYVRLTWFNTAQLDRLAPLVVLPRPDTVIRVFLDFKGLDSFASIPPQNLTALPRKGFTVVEWGGLLRK